MTVAKRRPANPGNYFPDSKEVQAQKKFNEDSRYVAGFSQSIGANSEVPINMQLPSPGKKFLGISIIPVAGSDISNCQATLNINNNVVLSQIAAQNANPNFVGSMIFFPAPQALNGNDTIKLNIKNNSGSSVTVTANAFYVPRV